MELPGFKWTVTPGSLYNTPVAAFFFKAEAVEWAKRMSRARMNHGMELAYIVSDGGRSATFRNGKESSRSINWGEA